MDQQEKEALVAALVEAVRAAGPFNPLTEEEKMWVRTAIKREAKRAEFYDKGLQVAVGSLTVSALAGIGWMVLEVLRNHGVK